MGEWINGIKRIIARIIIVLGDIYTVPWTDYFGTSTINGWSGYTHQELTYKKVGKLVFVQFSIIGTSDAANTNFTLPFANSTRRIRAMIFGYDNGSVTAAMLEMVSGSSQVVLYRFPSVSHWTASGAKQVIGQFWYEAA